MTSWKKIIFSGSNAEFNTIKGSTLQLTDVSHSSVTTPLVIDSDGVVSTGSAYAPASGGTTVGGSDLGANIAILGSGSSLIQTASSTVSASFNGANLKGITDLTASNASFDNVSINSKTSFKTESTTELVIPSTDLTSFKVGTTMSLHDVPEATYTQLYLGVSSSGEVTKIDNSSLGESDRGSSNGSIVQSGSNINITGGSELKLSSLGSAYAPVSNASKIFQPIFYRSTNPNDPINQDTYSSPIQTTTGVTLGARKNPLAEAFDNGLAAGDTLKFKNDKGEFVTQSNGSQDFTIDSIGYVINTDDSILSEDSFMFLYTKHLRIDFVETESLAHQIQGYTLRPQLPVSASSVATINLDDNISLTSVTASAGLFFSASSDKNYTIDYAKKRDGEDKLIPNLGSLNITASKVKVEGNLDVDGTVDLSGNLSFQGFDFEDVSINKPTGNTTAGSGSVGAAVQTTTHQYTGSVFITGSDLKIPQGTVTAVSFSGDGNELSNLPLNQVGLSNLTQGNGISTFTYDGTSPVKIKIKLDGETLITSSLGLKISESGVTSNEIASSAVTTDKIKDGTINKDNIGNDIISGQTTELSGTNVSDSDHLLHSKTTDGTTSLSKVETQEIKNHISKSFKDDNLFGDVNVDTTYTLTPSAHGDGARVMLLDDPQQTGLLKFLPTTNEIKVSRASQTITFGLPNSTTVKNLTTTRHVTASNLVIEGEKTTIKTKDLNIEDRFITLGSGSDGTTSNVDLGIIFDSGSVDDIGMALFYDNSENRLAVGKNIAKNAMGVATNIGETGATGTAAGNIVTVSSASSVTPSSTPEFGKGEMRVDDNDNVWFYVGT